MRAIFALILAFVCVAGHAHGMEQESQTLLADFRAAYAKDDSAVKLIQSDFNELLRVADVKEPVELVVTDAAVIGQAFPGRVVVVTAELAQVSRARRLFVLSHELGHVVEDHLKASFKRLGQLLDSHLEDFDEALKRLSPLLHEQEFGADQYAASMLRRMGLSPQEGGEVLGFLMDVPATLTHPAVADRLQRLRSY
jgi:Zn-dependent protease with chaperone function